ncbi:MAG: hypothetical protein KA100_00420 [Rickettsiales bacterium]|nr:hypothetical protein [Rickettsiales bacterium]
MKKLLLILLLLPTTSFAARGKCHRQSNPMGYANYDVCEVAGAGYSCVSLEGKGSNGISCFPTPPALQESEEHSEANSVKRKNRFKEEVNGGSWSN